MKKETQPKAKKQLSAKNMKDTLWETFLGLEAGTTDVATADAIASQSREIIRVIKTQQSIISQANEKLTQELIDYAIKTD